MTQEKGSELQRAVRSTETARSVNKLAKEWYAKAEQARAEGRPVAWCMVGMPPQLLYVFGIEAVWPENYGTVCAARQMAVHFMEIAEADGYSHDLCSYERNAFGYAKRMCELGAIPTEAPVGGLPEPDLLLTPSQTCDPRCKGFQALATRFTKAPLYVCDLQSVPYGLDMNDETVRKRYLKQNVEQMWGLVHFLEKETGKKLDEAKLSEAVVNSLKAQRLIWEVHQLRRALPSPMPSEDQFACIIPQLYMLGSPEAVDFYQRLYDEVKYRVDHKIGVIPNEKYRLLWMGIPTWFNMGIFNYFESLGAVSAMETTYYVYPPVTADPSRPVEALAEIYWKRNRQLHDLGAEVTPESGTPAGLVLEFIREYKLDGVVMHATRSCRAIAFGQAHTRKRLQKELDVPVVAIESDMADPRTWSDALIKMQLNAFIETMASKKAGAAA